MFGTQKNPGGSQVVSLGLRPLTPQITNGAPHSELFSTGDDAAGVLPPNNPEDGGGSGSSDNSLFGDDSDEEAQRKPKHKPSGLSAGNGSGALSPDVVMTAYMNGKVLLWDRRAPAQTKPLRLEMGEKTPPWCVSVSSGISPPIAVLLVEAALSRGFSRGNAQGQTPPRPEIVLIQTALAGMLVSQWKRNIRRPTERYN